MPWYVPVAKGEEKGGQGKGNPLRALKHAASPAEE